MPSSHPLHPFSEETFNPLSYRRLVFTFLHRIVNSWLHRGDLRKSRNLQGFLNEVLIRIFKVAPMFAKEAEKESVAELRPKSY
jgi:hypothetical protein